MAQASPEFAISFCLSLPCSYIYRLALCSDFWLTFNYVFVCVCVSAWWGLWYHNWEVIQWQGFSLARNSPGRLDKLASKPKGSACRCLPSSAVLNVYQHAQLCLYMVGDLTQVLLPTRTALYQLRHTPQPVVLFSHSLCCLGVHGSLLTLDSDTLSCQPWCPTLGRLKWVVWSSRPACATQCAIGYSWNF